MCHLIFTPRTLDQDFANIFTFRWQKVFLLNLFYLTGLQDFVNIYLPHKAGKNVPSHLIQVFIFHDFANIKHYLGILLKRVWNA